MTTLFDQETVMRNHDAEVRREGKEEGRAEGRAEGQMNATKLMNYLWSNGRGDDAIKAGQDEGFLAKLLAEFQGGMMVAK